MQSGKHGKKLSSDLLDPNAAKLGIKLLAEADGYYDQSFQDGTLSASDYEAYLGDSNFLRGALGVLTGQSNRIVLPGDKWLGKWSGFSRYKSTAQVWEWWFEVSRICGHYSINTHTSGPMKVGVVEINSQKLTFLFHDKLGTRIEISLTGNDTYAGSVTQPNNSIYPSGNVDGRRIAQAETDVSSCTAQACSWRSTGLISDHTGSDDPPISAGSSFPTSDRCNSGYEGFTATCWDGVAINHPGSAGLAWCTYKHVPLSSYGNGVNNGNVYECSCRKN